MNSHRATLRLPPSDTAPEVERLIVEGYRRMTPAEKMRCIEDMRQTAAHLAAAGIRARHRGDLSDRELRLRIAALSLDRDLMIAACGWDPRGGAA